MEIKSPTGGCCIPPRGEGYAIHNKNTKWPSLSCLEVLFGLRVVWVDFQYWRIFWFARWKVSSPSRFSFFWALVLDNHMILCGIRKTFDKSHEDRHKGSRGESNCCISVTCWWFFFSLAALSANVILLRNDCTRYTTNMFFSSRFKIGLFRLNCCDDCVSMDSFQSAFRFQ